MKSGTIRQLDKIIQLVKSLDPCKEEEAGALYEKLTKRQKAEDFQPVDRAKLNMIVHNLAVAKSNFEVTGNYDKLNEAWNKEVPTLRKVLSENVLFDKIEPKKARRKVKKRIIWDEARE